MVVVVCEMGLCEPGFGPGCSSRVIDLTSNDRCNHHKGLTQGDRIVSLRLLSSTTQSTPVPCRKFLFYRSRPKCLEAKIRSSDRAFIPFRLYVNFVLLCFVCFVLLPL